MTLRILFTFLFLARILPAVSQSVPLDLSQATVYTPAGATMPERKAAQMLVEEIQKRTRIRLNQSGQWPMGNGPVIAVGQTSNLRKTGRKTPAVATAKDGFQVKLDGSGPNPILWVQGNDPRGTVFGAGWLLRNLSLQRDKVMLNEALQINTAPQTPLRGHQLGFRAKANSYDAWDLRQWEQYIRDLAVFGTNTVELLPPRTDDALDSPHFPLPPMETMIGMSRIADDYGLDVWVWYPALEDDYTKPETLQKSLTEWGSVLGKLPRLNGILVPCGDPGSTPPDVLFTLLEKQAAQLKKYHPKAQWWISPQGFGVERLAMLKKLIEPNPAWLTGMAYGPWMRQSLAEFRQWLPARYPIRQYPDITHSHRCQYPVPDWDFTFVQTEHREPINPRPLDMATIFRHSAPHTIGYITYSEGCNDDVNKILWSALGWDRNQPVQQILREYSRYFIGEAEAGDFADGLMALEQNWRGPALENAGIDRTLARFQQLEQSGKPGLLTNWRFQQALLRAYYDAWVRQRRQYEHKLETEALALLDKAGQSGPANAMKQAAEVLARSETQPVALPLRTRVMELGEALFQSIRMQLLVKRHTAGRSDGAMLERIDYPLNNRPYLLQRFGQIAALPDEATQRKELQTLVAELNPPADQPGVWYDDLGNPARQPHLVRTGTYESNPDFLQSPLTFVDQRTSGNVRYPISWYTHVLGLYDQAIHLHYDGLDRNAQYKVRVVYASGPVQLVANQNLTIHPLLRKEMIPLEFNLPAEATQTGSLDLRWTGPPGAGDSGRGNQVSEVWLIKQ